MSSTETTHTVSTHTVSTDTGSTHTVSTDTTTMLTCQSCGMPIESGKYCDHCTDEAGNLQSFDECFERLSSWQARSHPNDSSASHEKATLEYMATMPAWRDHPRVVAR